MVRCCKLALAANTDRYTDRLLVVLDRTRAVPKGMQGRLPYLDDPERSQRVSTLSRDDSKNS